MQEIEKKEESEHIHISIKRKRVWLKIKEDTDGVYAKAYSKMFGIVQWPARRKELAG